MSVLIKGMKMPSNCQNCFASDDECRFCRATKKYIPMVGKPKFCPLVELPDHGDLIDAEEQMRLMRSCEYDTYDDYNRAFDMLDNAPTIISAERSK